MPATLIRSACVMAVALIAVACAPVGPDFVRPEPNPPRDWSVPPEEGLATKPLELVQWWKTFNDPVLDELVETARLNSNTLEIAGLRVLEARAQLGIATGLQYPQTRIQNFSFSVIFLATELSQNIGINQSFPK